MGQFSTILVLITFAVIFVAIFRRLKLPPVLGYLVTGILVGPGGLKWIPSIEYLHFLAEFGIVFLMFTLGLEFSIPRLMATKRILLGVGGLQVGLCTIVGMAGAYLLNLNPIQSFIIGGALAFSSTAVVVKQLTEQKLQTSSHGSLSINILIFQDIAAVLFLILIPALAGDTNHPLWMSLSIALVKGVGVFIALALLGLWLLRPLFHEVAKAHSNELFMLATLLVVLAAAAVTHYFDLSMALGAFLAGLMLGETEFRHQIELDIRPFRDVLLGLFFVIIGTYLEITQIPDNWFVILAILLALIIIKTCIIMGITVLFGSATWKTSLQTGIILAHGGEFGFVVLTEAIGEGILPAAQRPAIFSAVVLSVIVAPFLIQYNKGIAKWLLLSKKVDGGETPYPTHHLVEHAVEMKDHVILCGFGRVGQILARFLEQEHFNWLALDLDPMRISKSSIAGEHSFYGNATHPETLASAGLSRARMVVISFSDEHSALTVVKHVRAMRLDLPVFVRTQDDSNWEAFQQAGATEVVPESLEGSLMLASHLLLTLGVPTHRLFAKIRRVHTNRYETLRGFYTGTDDAGDLEVHSESRRSLHTIIVPESAFAVDKTLDEIFDPTMDGPTVKALTRNNQRLKKPAGDTLIQAKDVIVIFATPEETYKAEEKIFSGE